MKKILLALLTLGFMQQAIAQNFVREMDTKSKKPILRGLITFQDIQDETVCNWFNKGAEAYNPNEMAIKELRSVWTPYRFVVFVGTWCEDTQYLLPRFYKTLQDAGIDMHSVEMYGVNRDKTTLNLEHVFYNIQRVPTIIVMQQHREVGRIVETANFSIEEDLVRMLEKDAPILERQRIPKN
jgi:thiol-disulfide isomerase/thioredoxin